MGRGWAWTLPDCRPVSFRLLSADWSDLYWSSSYSFLFLAGAFVALASTLSRVFQVREMARVEVVGKYLVRGGNLFQVRFRLFQVRVGSGWKSDSYSEAFQKCVENGGKIGGETTHKGREGREGRQRKRV
jgi:hypothetical protein